MGERQRRPLRQQPPPCRSPGVGLCGGPLPAPPGPGPHPGGPGRRYGVECRLRLRGGPVSVRPADRYAAGRAVRPPSPQRPGGGDPLALAEGAQRQRLFPLLHHERRAARHGVGAYPFRLVAEAPGLAAALCREPAGRPALRRGLRRRRHHPLGLPQEDGPHPAGPGVVPVQLSPAGRRGLRLQAGGQPPGSPADGHPGGRHLHADEGDIRQSRRRTYRAGVAVCPGP